MVGSGWVGTAAKLGAAHTVFWLLAICLFYLPLAVTITYLNRLMPLEGGVYQWAKLGFNEFWGFFVGWNLWLYIILFISAMGLMLTTDLSYAFQAPWMTTNRACIAGITCALVLGLIVVTTLGLGVGKWVQNVGGVAQILTFGALLALPFLQWGRTPRGYHPLHLAVPAVSLLSLNIFGKMSMGALSGFEYVAILAGECRNPVRAIGRSVLIATPVIVLMFILGTDSLLAYVQPRDVDLVGPIPQGLSAGLRALGFGGPVAALVILMLTGRQIGATTLAIAGASRLPMVAGWDHILPEWFSRLHPRFRTPVNSVLFVGALVLTMGLAGSSGVGHQEGFQILENASGIFYGLAYLVMFALPLFGLRQLGVRPSPWLRIAAASGFAVTLLYAALSIFPILDVSSTLTFGMKIGGVVAGANVLGGALYAMRSRRGRLTRA